MSGAALFVLTALMAGAVAILAPVLLRVRGPVAQALAAGVAFCAQVVVLSTVLSFDDRYGDGAMVAAHGVLAVAVLGVWLRAGRPRPLRGLPARRGTPGRVVAAARSEPLVAAFAAVMVVVAAVQLFQALAVVSNGWDPLAYHLSRAAHWVQEGSIGRFEGGTARQLGYPPNGELLQAWTMLLSGGDGLVNVVQWFAWLGSGLAVFAGARLLRFGRAAALLAALLFCAMPIPVMQATTSQNDLIATFLVMTGAVLGVRGLRDGHLGEAAVAAAAIALAIGTKGIVLVAGPSLVLLAAVVVWKAPPARRILAKATAIFAACVVAFAAFGFVENLVDTGDLYGDARAGTERTVPIVDNAVRVWWGFADAPGVPVPWLEQALAKWAPDVLGDDDGFAYTLDTAPNDSQSAFGLVAPLVLLPVLVLYLVRRRSAADRRLAAGAALLFFLVFPFAANHDPDLTRLAVAGVALGAPLFAALGRRPALAGIAVALSLATLVPSVVLNPLRQLLAPDGALATHQLDRATQFGQGRGPAAQAVAEVDRLVAPNARIAFIGGDAAWEYPFFGPHLERRIVRRLSSAGVTLAWMRERGLAAAVVDGVGGVRPPRGMRTIAIAEDFWLVLAEPAPGRS